MEAVRHQLSTHPVLYMEPRLYLAEARAPGGMMMAHATTGPAKGPRPTSSTPAMYRTPVARRSRSIALQRATRAARPAYASAAVPVAGTATRTFRSLMRADLPVTLRR